MNIIIKSRNMPIKDDVRELTYDKLETIDRVDPTLGDIEVEYLFEPNPARGSDGQYKVHFTAYSKHGTQRIESVAGSPRDAFDDGVSRLQRVLRKQRDKAISHR